MEWWLAKPDRWLLGPFPSEAAAEAQRTDEWSEADVVSSPKPRRPAAPKHRQGCSWYRGGTCECGAKA